MASRALLFSIRPKYAKLIFSGGKKMELRRTRPRVGADDLALVYASSPLKSLVGAFWVTDVVELPPNRLWEKAKAKAAVTKEEFDDYFKGAKIGFGIEFSRYWELAEPVSLRVLRKRHRGFRPPQSFRYLPEVELGRLIISSAGKRDAISNHLSLANSAR